MPMPKHNIYFDGKVQSLGFERLGRNMTVGVIDTGEYHFNTDAPERICVTSGELFIRFDGTSEWCRFPAGVTFEVAGNGGFDVKVQAPSAYLCEFL